MESASKTEFPECYDLLVVGGGINGCGIAADGSLRGLKVLLCEMNDLASATSSRSSKLIHGGLRYLEFYQFGMVRKALEERENLLRIAPHIIHPLRFRLPHQPQLRPAWMIRAGLLLYDHLSRHNTQPRSRSIRFTETDPIRHQFKNGYEYSDAWVDDARLVILNARAAANHSAQIRNYCQVVNAQRLQDHWQVTLKERATGAQSQVRCRVLVNATGPWVNLFYQSSLSQPSPHSMRLVKGSHIVVPRIHDQPQAYILQNDDGRIVFVIPYHEHYSMVGTTDVDYQGDPGEVEISESEQLYLLDICNRYFKVSLDIESIRWQFAGVRPLLNDSNEDAHATSRDYQLELEQPHNQAPLLSVFGGKLTSYRVLAQQAVDLLGPLFQELPPCKTQHQPLPGGDFQLFSILKDYYQQRYPWLPATLLDRWLRSYGTMTEQLIGECNSTKQLGTDFGQGLYQREVDYLIDNEWAQSAEDILWRRSKLGIERSVEEEKLTQYLSKQAILS
ncbi:MAG: glycerol-3-phosphate dehydrogenase [Motiliproteus sp.]|nr:glycerol-3-phosphate dehydrogenase [Motiliproteus sp.]MCW9051653.1 glycerol-3-phosphate dehydrogenase [Motiliproteus sp.]